MKIINVLVSVITVFVFAFGGFVFGAQQAEACIMSLEPITFKMSGRSSNSITWKWFDAAGGTNFDIYEVFINGNFVRKTDRQVYTAKGLRPNTSYTIEVIGRRSDQTCPKGWGTDVQTTLSSSLAKCGMVNAPFAKCYPLPVLQY